MKIYYLFLLGFLFSTALSAQNVMTQSLVDFYRDFKTAQFTEGIGGTDKSILGSPHENPDFVPGIVETNSNVRYENIPLRFNIYANEMEFKTEEGQVLVFATPEVLEFIEMDGQRYVYSPYILGNKLMRGYFKVITDGKASLLLKQNVSFRQAELPQAYKDAEPAQFIKTSDDFYVRLSPEEAHRVTNKKELLNILKDKNKEVDTFLSKNRIRFNKIEDLKSVLDYYNSLE